MSSKKKKYYLKKKIETSNDVAKHISKHSPGFSLSPLKFTFFVTLAFFLFALIGLLNHELWRDEHQAWLVARDAQSLSQLLDNMKYEGNPALWHFFLFIITRFSHDPVYMQLFHLLVAVSFIFIFNRYAPLSNLHKILFSFGYFPLYEYGVISRSYGLGVLLIFSICALYKHRISKYILIGFLLALLANVTIYALVIGAAIAGVLILDYFYYQQKNFKTTLQLGSGMVIFLAGLLFSLYQVWPEKDNSFPAPYATTPLEISRWFQTSAKIFTTYFYIPQLNINFWNTTIFYKDPGLFGPNAFWPWIKEHPGYYLGLIIFPIVTFITGISLFIRKPLVLLLYLCSTLGLFAIYYYTALLHVRYSGYMFIALIACYWISEYYPSKNYKAGWKDFLSLFGKKIYKPILTIMLVFSLIGSLAALSVDMTHKFSPSKDVADYIKINKIDTLPIVGVTDFTISPLSTFLDTSLYYPQMDSTGSFTIWNSKRKNTMTFQEVVAQISKFMNQGHDRVLWVKDSAPQLTADNGQKFDIEAAIIGENLQLDLLKKFDPGIVADEKYYIYLVQKVDPSKVDASKYIRIN